MPKADLPPFVIRDRILASLRQAEQQWLTRQPQQCASFAEWEVVSDERARCLWPKQAS
jgi:hypothetical protein